MQARQELQEQFLRMEWTGCQLRILRGFQVLSCKTPPSYKNPSYSSHSTARPKPRTHRPPLTANPSTSARESLCDSLRLLHPTHKASDPLGQRQRSHALEIGLTAHPSLPTSPLVRKNCSAILCGCCCKFAKLRTHSDNGSALITKYQNCLRAENDFSHT